MIDARRYNRFRLKGLTNVIKKDDDYYLTFKRFSVEDGSELPAEEQLIQIDEIEKRIEYLKDEIDGMTRVLEEVKNIK